ncbi:MAG: site-2 protease family protein [Chlorobi bacterium]|nr:site-2 protease family protein [Chlorobiota bacterium]
MEWTTGKMGPYEVTDLVKALPYTLGILFFLSAHEFGHYFAAKYHKVKTTLPYYIPFPPLAGFLNFGTMGAVIKIKQRIPTNKAMFDIGVAGPIAGFVVSLGLLIYGFTHLPGREYILNIHPDFFSPEYNSNGISLAFGDTLLFDLLRYLFTNPSQFIPPMSEIYHYPFLCVGWFGLFVTALNMIPVGQLDGGHVVYSMFGLKNHEKIAAIFLILLLAFGVFGLVDVLLELNMNFGWSGWLLWSMILYFVIKVKHPPATYFEKLDPVRMTVGYISLIVFLLSFSPAPFVITF